MKDMEPVVALNAARLWPLVVVREVGYLARCTTPIGVALYIANMCIYVLFGCFPAGLVLPGVPCGCATASLLCCLASGTIASIH